MFESILYEKFGGVADKAVGLRSLGHEFEPHLSHYFFPQMLKIYLFFTIIVIVFGKIKGRLINRNVMIKVLTNSFMKMAKTQKG